MNKKTFTLAVVFLCLTLLWVGRNVYWLIAGGYCVTKFDLVVAVLFVLAGSGKDNNECKKKKRRHLDEVNRHKIP